MLKIAVPTRGGLVDEHFGHCESFTIFTVDDARNIVGEEAFTPPPACGCKSGVIATLTGMGVTALLGGNMGEGAYMKLKQSGFTVLRGASGPVRQVAQDFVAGQLRDQADLCQAHHHGCEH